MSLGFMQPIGGKVISYKVDIDADKKLKDISLVIKEVKDTLNSTFAGTTTPEYDKGVKDMAEMIEEIINK